MKTLNLHCDHIKFKALKKALKQIDELAPVQTKEGDAQNCLAVLIAVEKDDNLKSAEQLTASIQDIANQVQTKSVVLYPYAHLSKNLSSPETAIEILNATKKSLSEKFDILQAPFGYYKQLELKIKGHPLSELSREFKISESEESSDISEKERKRLLRQVSKAKLDTSKLADNDHRIIGNKLNLWSFNNVAPGMVFWHPKGLHIKNKLIEFWRDMHRQNKYEEISTPQVMDRKLWEISGHWKLYKENNFKTSYEKRDFLVKPMNCPGGMLVYKTSPKTYKDLPLRVGEIGTVHRVELSGTLGGLFRVIQFTQDDAHIFCTQEQLHSEIVGVLKLFLSILDQFKFKKYRFTISIRSEEKKSKYLGNDKTWEEAEGALAKGLDDLGVEYTIEKGEAKFYGPSLDIQIEDSLGREWQCSTLQLDFALPERFEMKYIDQLAKERTPIMLHRVVLGSFERFLGVYTEHLNGNFPLWLSPNQVKILTLNDAVKPYAKQIYDTLFQAGYQVELNDKSESMNKKVKEASIQKFNYILTVGEKEQQENSIAIKKRGEKEINKMTLEDFKKQLQKEVKNKTL